MTKQSPDDKPLPSVLLLAYLRTSPLHIVVGINEVDKDCVLITVYVPEPELWTPDFTRKRKS